MGEGIKKEARLGLLFLFAHSGISLGHVEVILPLAADFQIVPGQAFFLKTQLAQKGKGGEVPGHHIGFHPVETKGAEGIVHHGGHGFGHIPLP